MLYQYIYRTQFTIFLHPAIISIQLIEFFQCYVRDLGRQGWNLWKIISNTRPKQILITNQNAFSFWFQEINNTKRWELHLLYLVLFLITVVMRGEGSVVVAVVREVKGGAIAVGHVEHRYLQVLCLSVQRLLPAAEVGAWVCIGQQGLHLPRLALPVEAGGSTDARPTGATALWSAVPQRLWRQLQTTVTSGWIQDTCFFKCI